MGWHRDRAPYRSHTISAEDGGRAVASSSAPDQDPAQCADNFSISSIRRAWVLALLSLMMLSNYIDRGILNILAQPIKEELHINDFQIGLLGGLSFALLYIVMGIPIARLADTRSRVWIITISMFLWSGMTMLCGLATSFLQLFCLRVGVGIGEAGAGPPAQSLISDYFPPRQRATALSFFSIGTTLGGVLGAVIGGAVAQIWGWRIALMVAGIPGVVVAALLRLSTHEPPRGHHDFSRPDKARRLPSLFQATRHLVSIPTWTIFTLGAGASNFAAVGVAQFSAAFLLRRFGLSLSEVGLITGTLGAAAALFGTILGGWLSDAAARRDPRAYAWIGGGGMCAAGILMVIAYLQPTWQGVIAFLFFANCCAPLFVGPILGVNQNLAPPRMRATAVALITVVTAGLGFGVGPAVAGLLSDHFASQSFALGGHAAFSVLCPGGVAPVHAAPMLISRCAAASATGVARALVLMPIGHLLGGLVFLTGARTIRSDLARAATV